MRPYRAKRLCEGCAAIDRLRGIEKAAQDLWRYKDAETQPELKKLYNAWLDLRDALNVPKQKGDQ